MKMTLDTTNKNAFFPAKSNMLDDLIQQELIETTGVFMHKRRDFFKGHNRDTMFIKSNLSWDLMLHSNSNSLSDVQAIQNLKAQGVEFEGLAEADAVYRPMKKRHDRLSLTLEEFKETPAFQRAVDMVTDVHGEHLFPYQIECAALIASRKRLLNAMDMGLGSAKRSV